MIQSMTGYGSAQCTENGVSIALELRSLNNRYYKSSIRLPEPYQFLEGDVDALLRDNLQRGSVSFQLRVKDQSPQAAVELNQAAIGRYIEQLEQAGGSAEIPVSIDLASLLNMPGVSQAQELDEAGRAKAWELISGLIADAVKALVDMRTREGLALREDMLAQCSKLREHLEAVSKKCPDVVSEYQQRLEERVNRLLQRAKLELDQDSLIKEVALFADRCDINEEISRLTSHLDQFARLCDNDEQVGRKLDFLTQEMLREANTIGSKSGNAEITRHVVEMKSLIDRLKEQVQNVA